MYAVEMVYRGNEVDRISSAEEHRMYWKRLAEKGMLLGGGPWEDGTGEFLLCDARDRSSLLKVLYADPYAQSQVISELRVREWNAVMGHVILAGLERAADDRGAVEPLRARTAGRRTRRMYEELTAHERRIADMMLDGMTNKQIAEVFSVSTRAIELHITSMYRKLDIRRRAQLATAMDQFATALAS
ncbi:LuxR C-terminal-related transcriptional regulator [Actinacidiphila sp. ITFR-21]|uniref:LuxR C-terminal-related transcriptional regulator n=1 Tax=Actinacidiphila sp. ITFR-21 TaxID=3075199 RepID=UPI00288B4C0C|nr:LuxR C-terminal-related transcriptional regulator [Streptomyces sp. ITFR-21]WNI14302.1 LuxR C-terminal-related transcriptional regulator [Streptomyces sp. ITFR-21]